MPPYMRLTFTSENLTIKPSRSFFAGYNEMTPAATLLCPHRAEAVGSGGPGSRYIGIRQPNVYHFVTDE